MSGTANDQPKGRRPFLTATWSNLLLVSYHVDRSKLTRLIPPGCELDLIEGKPAVSLVAFDFLNTRVKGVCWPAHVNFPEINLRFYVRRSGRGSRAGDSARRGVSFVREFVPRRLIAWAASTIYNEPYVACRMRSRVAPVTLAADGAASPGLHMRHDFTIGGRGHVIEAIADAGTWTPPEDSAEHWFKEHQWGYGRDRRGRALVYEVRHPVWEVHRVRKVDFDLDFAKVYGPEWAFLKDAPPISFVWAKGSPIEVYPHGLA